MSGETDDCDLSKLTEGKPLSQFTACESMSQLSDIDRTAVGAATTNNRGSTSSVLRRGNIDDAGVVTLFTVWSTFVIL